MQKRWPTCALCPNWCVLCPNEWETQDHMLIHCKFTSGLWARALEEMRLYWVVPKSTQVLFASNLGDLLGKRVRIFWNAVIHGICWFVWLERNRRLFENFEESNEQCWEKIKIHISTWIGSHIEFRNVSISDLLRDWSYIYC